MEKCSYFVCNVLVQVRLVFLPDHHLVLYLLKPKDVGVFWNIKKKKSDPNRKSPLNSSIDNILVHKINNLKFFKKKKL